MHKFEVGAKVKVLTSQDTYTVKKQKFVDNKLWYLVAGRGNTPESIEYEVWMTEEHLVSADDTSTNIGGILGNCIFRIETNLDTLKSRIEKHQVIDSGPLIDYIQKDLEKMKEIKNLFKY